MIPFDIKYKDNILSGKMEVVTRNYLPVEIVKWDMNNVDCLLFVVTYNSGVQSAMTCKEDGKLLFGSDTLYDLFVKEK